MTSSVTSPIESPRPLSYRLPIVTYPVAALVFEIFDLKVADKQTNPQNSTLCDNKGPLKLALANQQNSTSTDNKGPLKLALANQLYILRLSEVLFPSTSSKSSAQPRICHVGHFARLAVLTCSFRGHTRPLASEVSPSGLLSSGTHFHMTSANHTSVTGSSDRS